MPRGKKTAAAEKYIERKLKGVDAQVRSLQASLDEARRENKSLARQLQLAQEECDIYKAQVEELKKLYDLSASDVKALVERSQFIKDFAPHIVRNSTHYT